MANLHDGDQLTLIDFAGLDAEAAENTANLHRYWLHPELLSSEARHSPSFMRCLDVLGPLDWGKFPERNMQRNYGQPTLGFSTVAATTLVGLHENILHSWENVHRYLIEHPGFISPLGYPTVKLPNTALGFNALASLPNARHLGRMLKSIPNIALQFLLADSVRLILQELRNTNAQIGDCISLDTKHILAWVKENNPKAYVPERFNKTLQPAGDPDCKLGCKRRRNITPAGMPKGAAKLKFGEFYWGYGSGLVVAKAGGLGEFVIAELTQPFDKGDLSYFHPLMRQTEQRLGFKPHFGAFDAAFDAFYVYAYFSRGSAMSDGFAAVPFSEKGGKKVTHRTFSSAGLPICQAGLPMPLKFAFTDHTSALIEHERGRYVCPLLHPTKTAPACPLHHKLWRKGGCTVQMPTSEGARIRYTLNRDGYEYKEIYNQRTAVERINSQAVALGIERPHLRNGDAIANLNTLIYTLVNLRFLQRLRCPV